MANTAFYQKHFGISTAEELFDFFFQNQKRTNQTPDFFVNWKKILVRIDKDDYRDALNLLAGIHQVNDPSAELKRLLLKDSRTGDIVADMLAIRKQRSKPTLVILPKQGHFHEIPVVFKKKKKQALSEDEAAILTLFARQSGLLSQLSKIVNLWDYVFGVEVGRDSNARKNRSGKLGEDTFSKYVLAAVEQKDLQYALKTKPSRFMGKEKIVRKSPLDRNFDALICSGSKIMAVEVNFYNTGGTKLDSIASDYQKRARDCKQAGLTFVWVTDGQGWNSSKGMLRQAIENIDYIFNFELLERGALTTLCDEVFR